MCVTNTPHPATTLQPMARKTTVTLPLSLSLSLTLCTLILPTVALPTPAHAQADYAHRLPTEVGPGQPLPPDPEGDTTSCPYKYSTPPAVDTSEQVAPGQPSPTPLPVPSSPVGGDALGTCTIVTAEGFNVPTYLSTGAWLVYDLDAGTVLAAKDPHGRYRPASIIKVLIALAAIEELPLDRELVGTWEAANMEGSRAGIGPDGHYTVEQVLLGLLLNSGNDCAKMLADALGGDAATLDKLQKLADTLGATDTRVTSFSGLDAPGLQTSAYDLALFYRAAFNNPTFARLVHTEAAPMPGYPGRDEPFTIYNDNAMLFNYDGTIGGKTGFTDDARHTFAAAASRDGRRLGVILLNGTNAAGRSPAQAARLLDAAWAVTGQVGTLVEPQSDAPSLLPTTANGPGASVAAAPGGANTGGTKAAGPMVAVALGAGVLIVVAGVALLAAAGRKARRRPAPQGKAPAVRTPLPRQSQSIPPQRSRIRGAKTPDDLFDSFRPKGS